MVLTIAYFKFKHGESRGFQHLSAHQLRSIDANAERGDVMVLLEIQTQKAMQGQTGSPGCAVQHGHVQGATGRHRQVMDCREIIHACRHVGETKLPGIDALSKGCKDACHGLAVEGRGSGLADCRHTIGVGQSDDHCAPE